MNVKMGPLTLIKFHRQFILLIWGLVLLSASACEGAQPGLHTQAPILNRFEIQNRAHLAWSPDGKMLAFMQGNQPMEAAQLVLLDISTGNLKKLGDKQWNYDSPNQWSPDGTQIVVTKNDELWLIRTTDGNSTYLTKGEGASWSPDGQMLAVFRSPLSGGPSNYFQIAFISRDGEEKNAITAGAIPAPRPTPTPQPTDPNNHEFLITRGYESSYFMGMAWSPDGQSLVYSIVSPEEDRGDLFVIQRDGSGQHRITPTGYSTEPAWSPQDDRILYVFASPYNIPGDLFMTTSMDNCHLRLTTGGGVSAPSWSPDGHRIALTAFGYIYILDVEKYLTDEYFDPQQCKN